MLNFASLKAGNMVHEVKVGWKLKIIAIITDNKKFNK